MSDELGSGLALDGQWDLYVDDSNGDLAFSEAGEEVRKDLAFQIARLLEPFVGTYLGDGKRADVRIAVRKLIANDPRIAEINQLEVTIPDTRRDEIQIDALLTTTGDTQIDAVFTAAA